MSISMLLEMAAAGDPARTALVSDDLRVTTAELSDMAGRAAESIAGAGAGHVAYVGTGGIMMPLLLFGAARAARAFTPLNYRLGAPALRDLIERLPAPLVVAVVVPAPGPVPETGELRGYVRTALRGSRTPDRIVFRNELPTTPTGKVLRRVLVDELTPVPSNSEEIP